MAIGDDNAVTLEIVAENRGEGAYEAELHVFPPQQADFTGVVRSQVGKRRSQSLPPPPPVRTRSREECVRHIARPQPSRGRASLSRLSREIV